MFEYKTKVRFDAERLANELPTLKARYDEIGNRDTKEGRSRFHNWNNSQKFYERLGSFTDNVLEVTGSATGGTARVYFKPSVTSLPKVCRKAIIPLNPDNQFIFTDIKAAEFAMGCIFAQESEAVAAYQRGEDIYMHYAYMFPEGTSRDIIKKILIANMYNKTAYSTALDLGISEGRAQMLLNDIARKLPRMTMLKRRIYAYDVKHGGYFAPKGFDQTNLIKVADINPAKGFDPDYAANCYIQSALGFVMQDLTTALLPLCRGTVLSVFDSVLIEHSPESAPRLEQWLTRHFAPLRPDKFGYGKTFWEAAYGE